MQKRFFLWFQQINLLLLSLWQLTLTLSILRYFNSTVTTFAVRFVRKQRINNTNSMVAALVFLWAWQGFYEKKLGYVKMFKKQTRSFFVDLYISRFREQVPEMKSCLKTNASPKLSFFSFLMFCHLNLDMAKHIITVLC